jgi:hypothetical protein
MDDLLSCRRRIQRVLPLLFPAFVERMAVLVYALHPASSRLVLGIEIELKRGISKSVVSSFGVGFVEIYKLPSCMLGMRQRSLERA